MSCLVGEVERSSFTTGLEGERLFLERLSIQMASLETDRLLASLEADRLSRQIASFEGEEREREGRLRDTEPFSLLSGDLAREGGGLIWRLRFWEVSDWELDLEGG